MKTKFFIALCIALTLCVEVYAEGEQQEVRRGLFPYMAFLYYSDESVVDSTGSRFLRGAILIRPDWLVTSAVGPSTVAGAPNGFPRKTLLARLGAITIDTNFTLNEDEDEQEREVIRIVRPYNNSATQWWRTDISLMKVLLAFNITSAVSFTSLNLKHDIADKTCAILVYAKRNGNDTEDRSLMQITVEMQPPSIEACGSHYTGNTMTCAADSDDMKNAAYDSNFCQGNSGGPLICENEVVGIQTYIDNNCKQPHLYQLLSGWDHFISCGIDDKCQETQCSHICDVANKDAPAMSTTRSSEKTKAILMRAESIPVPQITSAIPETTTEDIEIVTVPQTSEETTTTDIPTSVLVPTPTHTVSESETGDPRAWPNEKYTNEHKNLEQGEIENTERKPNVEAQHHEVRVKKRSAGQSNVANTLSIFFGFNILACLI